MKRPGGQLTRSCVSKCHCARRSRIWSASPIFDTRITWEGGVQPDRIRIMGSVGTAVRVPLDWNLHATLQGPLPLNSLSYSGYSCVESSAEPL